MASTPQTKLRIAASVLFATGFFDAVAGRFVWEARRSARQSSPAPLTPYHDLAGALHVHTTYSDGAGDVPTVMEAAREAGVDFVLLADHNTQKPLRDGWEEKYTTETPFLLIGTEVTVKGGTFLLALEAPPEYEPRKGEQPQIAVDGIRATGAMPLISLPFDIKHPWTAWDVQGYDGLEVLNFSTIARRHINFLSLPWLLTIKALYGMPGAIRAIVSRPDAAMARWDDLTAGGKRQVVGIGSLDAHALMKIGRKKYPIPSYADSFRATMTHFLVRPEAVQNPADRRTAIYESLRAGRCYFSYDCLASPTGFLFEATNLSAADSEAVPMGGRVAAKPGERIRFTARVSGNSSRALIRLYRGGDVVAASTSGALEWEADGSETGAYRIEVYRYAARVGPLYLGARPWIFSNPVYV